MSFTRLGTVNLTGTTGNASGTPGKTSAAPGSKCQYCGSTLSDHALYCPHCLVPIIHPAPPRRPSNLTLCLSVALAFGLPCLWAIHGEGRSAAMAPRTVQAAANPAAATADAAQVLIARCGEPDQDISSADTDPPPPIPFRVLSYSRAQLQFDFVPGGNVHIGDPPPYRWALSGIIDAKTQQRVSPKAAAQRMDCFDPSLAGPAVHSPPQP